MTLNFKLGRQKKDGTCPLQIRFKDKGKDSIIAVSGVFIHPKMWQKHLNRVSPKHPMSQGQDTSYALLQNGAPLS